MDNIPLDKELLRKWLKAGFLEKHVLFATTEGTPQGGIASPVLANRALDGLQRLLEQRFSNTCRRRAECKVHLVRYEPEKNSSSVQHIRQGLCVVSLIVAVTLDVHQDKRSAHKRRIFLRLYADDFIITGTSQVLQQFPACGFRPENTLVLISHFANSLRTMLSRIPYLTAWANGVTRHGTCFR